MALGFVRPARTDDAGEIARIQLATWRTAYRRMFPPHVLAGLDEAYLARGWQEAITAPPSPRHRGLIAGGEEEGVRWGGGFAVAEAPGADRGGAERGVLVDRRFRRRGSGRRAGAGTRGAPARRRRRGDH